MNKKYIFALALFACFGGFKNINAGEDGAFQLYEAATTEDLKQLIQRDGNKIKDLKLSGCKAINFTDVKLDWKSCTKLETIDLSYSNITESGLQNILTQCTKLKDLNLLSNFRFIERDFDFETLNWSNCKNLEKLNLFRTDLTKDGLINILTQCTALNNLNLWNCNLLDATREEIERLKKDLGLENQKSLPINPKIPKKTQKPFWLVAKWQALPTPWKWALGIGAVAIPLIGACIFYKKQSIKNLSSALWRRLMPLLKRQKTANQPFIAQPRYQI